MGFISKFIKIKSIGISPEHLSNRLKDEIKNKVSSKITNAETKHGLVLEIEKFKIDGEGGIKFDNTGNTYYDVIVKARLYQPIVGEVLSTSIKDVSTHGFYVNEPVETFVVTSGRPTGKENDIVKIKITKVDYRKGKFIVLAKEI